LKDVISKRIDREPVSFRVSILNSRW